MGNKFEYKKASELSFSPREQMSVIFADGFYQWLKYFSKDKTRLAKAFEHIFDLDRFYVAFENDIIACIIACGDQNPPPISLDKKILSKELGFLRGRIAYKMLNKHIVNHSYPFDFSPETGVIEFVATAPGFRGQGIAGRLLAHVMEVSPYDEFILEVADTNTSAVHTYEKAGFIEFIREPAPKNSGFNYFVYMKR